jgi:hypothetical protein
MEKLRGRAFKKKVIEVLGNDNFEPKIQELLETSDSSMVSALFASLYNTDRKVRWHAVTAFGILAEHYQGSMSKVRDIIRRCIWMLTEESGGIAWGAPEVIGEIIARLPKLTDEYIELLFSYAYETEDDKDNYLEFIPFRRGVYWGILRVAQQNAEPIKKQEAILLERIEIEEDAEILFYLFLIGQKIKSHNILNHNKINTIKDISCELYLDNSLVNYSIPLVN